MGLLDRFRKKKEKPKESLKQEKIVSDLERICGDDKETYEALRWTMFLYPQKIEISLTDAVKKAKESEKRGDTLGAKMWYEIAGGLAIYEGDVTKVKEYFGKCAKLSPNRSYLILKNPEKAIERAQEYYKKYLT